MGSLPGKASVSFSRPGHRSLPKLRKMVSMATSDSHFVDDQRLPSGGHLSGTQGIRPTCSSLTIPLALSDGPFHSAGVIINVCKE